MSESWKAAVEAGNDAYSRNRIAEAEVKFLEALKEAEGFGEDDPRLALSLNNLAAIYHTMGKYTMAEPLYTRSLEIQRRIHGNDSAEVALNLHNLAVLYSARRMYPVAERYYKETLDTKTRLYGEHHAELLITLRYYAQLLKVLNRPVEMKLIEGRMRDISEKSEELANSGR